MNIRSLLTAVVITVTGFITQAALPAPSNALTPGVLVKVGKSCLKVGETTTLNVEASAFPKSFKWILPQGLEITDGSETSQAITVKATSEGNMAVGIEVVNAIGTTVSTVTALDVLGNEEFAALKNVLLGAKLLDYSGSATPDETPENIVDGEKNPSNLSKKWCVSGTDNYALFDCGDFYRFYGFKIYDCCSGPEQNENIRDWRIEVSDDNEAWTVIQEGNGTRINVKENYCIPTRGRYVKLIATPANNTMRVWEFEAIAAAASHLTIDVVPTSLRLNIGETSNIKLNYNLNGDTRCEDFECSVSASTSAAIIGEITDNGNGQITIPVTGGKLIGQTDLTIRLVNDGAYKEVVVPIIIDATGQPNVLSGLTAEIRYYANGYADADNFTTAYNTKLTDGDLNVNAFDGSFSSSHTDDCIALFNSGDDAWELSKVEIALPSNNSAKKITILVGSDLTSISPVHTITDIPEGTSKLEYIFPVSRRCRYLGILSDTEIGSIPALAEIEAYEQVSEAKGLSTPLKLNGWEDDMIVESLPAGAYGKRDFDFNGHFVYTTGVNIEGAIAGDSRELVSEKGTLFQLGEYDKKNACRIGFSYSGWKTRLDVAETAYCDELRLLVVAANGDNNLEAQVTYWVPDPEFPSDWVNESTEVIYMNIPDWTAAPSANKAITVGRVSSADDSIEPNSVHLYEFTIKTDPTKRLANIRFANRNPNSWPTVLAITKVVAAQSGIDKVPADKNKKVVGIYDLQGRIVKNPSSGVFVKRYSDGSAEKVAIR